MGEVSPPAPGLAWLDILRLPTPKTFASAFKPDAVLDASVLREPARGPAAIQEVFDATRGTYEPVAFLHETRSGRRTYLDWEGRFDERDVAGVTILSHDARGLIESVGLHHRPYDQVIAFSAELGCRFAALARK